MYPNAQELIGLIKFIAFKKKINVNFVAEVRSY